MTASASSARQKRRRHCLTRILDVRSNPVERLIGLVVPTQVGIDFVAEVVLRCEGASRDDAALEDGEGVLYLVEPGGVLRRKVSGPAGVVIEPLVGVVGIVVREVFHDDVAAAVRGDVAAVRKWLCLGICRSHLRFVL